MKQLTLRGFSPQLAAEIRKYADKEGLSLNRAVLKLLYRATGMEESGEDRVGDSLDHLAGTWTEEEEKEFLDSIDDFNQIDDEAWL